MAEINNVIAEASQDLQTIEDFVNLPAGSDVYPRLLPSVNVGTLAGARQAIFEAGGLPAKPFATKALMEASALVDGDYAQVTDGGADNGLYVKTAGAWVKSEYDPLGSSKAYTDSLGIDSYLKYNLFEFPELPDATGGATTFQATRTIENGEPVLLLSNTGTRVVIYEQDIGESIKVGDTVTLSAEVFSDAVRDGYLAGCELTILSYSSSDEELLRSTDVANTKVNEWEVLNCTSTIPENTAYLRLRLTARAAIVGTVFKFKNVILKSAKPQVLNLKGMNEIYKISQNIIRDVDVLKANALKYNLFKFPDLPDATGGAAVFNATRVVEGGENVLLMSPDGTRAVFYNQPLSENMKVGDSVNLEVDAYSSVVTKGCDISVRVLSEDGSTLLETPSVSQKLPSTWETLKLSFTIPLGAVTILVRLISRGGGTSVDPVFKFKNVVMRLADRLPTINLSEGVAGSSGGAVNSFYVSKTGSDSNIGSEADRPFLTIGKAVSQLPNGGTVTILDSGEYRESITIEQDGHIVIKATADNRVNILGSNKLEVTKTEGMTKVYQAPLAEKPVGMGGLRGKPTIFEWGTPSKLIPTNERHFLQRGLPYRLPYTEMFEASTKAELDSVNGQWFWEDGVIYFTATDGGDATLKRYEARARPVLTHKRGTIELIRITSWFSSEDGMYFDGLSTVRSSCISYGAFRNGFGDSANFTKSYRDISGGNGNDGFNAAVSVNGAPNLEIKDRSEQMYFDPYGHDNADDGLSCHYRCDSTVFGGLFEYNTKADVIHVYGANCVCYDTESRGTAKGFSVASDPVDDSERIVTVMRCVNTKATNNEYSYSSSQSSILICDNTVSINPTVMGYQQQNGDGAIIANDCRYVGEPLKAKSGNVVVANADALT